MKKAIALVMALLVCLLCACQKATPTPVQTEPAPTTEEGGTTYWNIEDDTTEPAAQPTTQPTTQQSKYPTLPTTGAPSEPEGPFLFSRIDFNAVYPVRTDLTESSYRFTDGGTYYYLGEVIDSGEFAQYSYNVRTDDLIEITAGPKDVSRLEIPKEIDGKTVAFIGSKAFRNCTAQELVLPDTILAVGDYAFKGSKQLKTVRLSKNLMALCLSCFSTCPNLTTCEIPASVEGLGERAFENCIKLSSDIHLSENCKMIASECFCGCACLNEVTMSEGLAYIGLSAFEKTRIKTCIFPKSVKDCGGYVFSGCSELEVVKFPEKFREEGFLGSGMFSECTKLKEVVLPSNIVSIYDGAFSYCESLTEIQIPKAVELIDFGAFEYCTNLKDVCFENANCSIDYNAFRGDTGTVIHAPSGGSIQRYCALNPFLRFSAN